MALPAEGAISLSQIASEFGDSTPNSLSEFYRGGGKVPNITTNNNVPTSGAISLSNFYSATHQWTTSATTSTSWNTSWDTSATTSWSTATVVTEGPYYSTNPSYFTYEWIDGNGWGIWWNSTAIIQTISGYIPDSYTSGGYTYYKGPFVGVDPVYNYYPVNVYQTYRTYPSTGTTSATTSWSTSQSTSSSWTTSWLTN